MYSSEEESEDESVEVEESEEGGMCVFLRLDFFDICNERAGRSEATTEGVIVRRAKKVARGMKFVTVLLVGR